MPLSIFKDFPVNSVFIETSEHNCIASEAETSDQFSFIKTKVTGGIVNLQTSFLSAKIKIKNNNADLNAATLFNITNNPLNTWAKQVQLSVNGVNIGIAHSFNQECAYLLNLLYGNVNIQKDLNGITLGYGDTPGQFEAMPAADAQNTNGLVNKGMKNKFAYLQGSDEVYVMDRIIYPLLYDGNQYIPSANEMKLEWTKTSNMKIFMVDEHDVGPGGNASDCHGLTAAQMAAFIRNNLKIHLKEFTWHLDYRTPNEQLKNALNYLLESRMAVVKSYVSQTRIVTKEHDLTTTSRLDNDIFNGSIPYTLFVFAMRQDRYNGAYNRNSLRIQWENIVDFQLSINGTAVGPRIKNSRQAYWYLRECLHKDGESMPFTFDQYEDDFGIIGVELCATKDSHIKVLPLRPEGNLSCSIEFTQNNNQNIVLYYLGIFPNQFNSPFASLPWMTYHY